MTDFNISCPIPQQQYPQILLAHGGGGKLMQQLLNQMFIPTFGQNSPETGLHDSVSLSLNSVKIAFTTDSYVIHPLFFPGGDIGCLAVYGTVNDLAMSGARPLYLSLGLIIEEGLAMDTLWQIVQSLQQAATKAGVTIVTGDTKVVDRGKGDGIFINTSGIGIIEHELVIAPNSVAVGDLILLSGDIGRHGIAIMAVREGLTFETTVESDCAPLAHIVGELLSAGVEIHCLRDLTRGGLASAINEIASSRCVKISLSEREIIVEEQVQGACAILGLDPLYVANEGRFIAFIPPQDAPEALRILQSHNPHARIIGEVTATKDIPIGLVTMESTMGSNRVLDLLSGEQLPRIC